MFVTNGEKSILGGSGDIVVIIHDVSTDRYHPCLFEEKPMPGPILPVEQQAFIRLKSKMYHTTGFDTFEEAKKSIVDKSMMDLQLPEGNIYLDEAIDADLSEDHTMVWVAENWVKAGRPFTKACIGG